MKKILEIILGVLIVGIIIGVTTFSIIQDRNKYNGTYNETRENIIVDLKEEIKDEVIINKGKIKNESLIDEFIEKSGKNTQVTLKISDEDNLKELKYFPGDISYLSGVQEHNFNSWEDFAKKYGYYELLVDGKRENIVDASRWSIKRNVQNEKINLYFYTYADMLCEFPIICEYNVEGSNYKKDFEISFYKTQNLKIDKIIDKNESELYDYNIYVFGGDVDIIIEQDMVYRFNKDTLEKKIITVDDILKQAELDYKYGVCKKGMYKDGGSIEYRYQDYTLLKYNTLSNNKDFVIGGPGQIINSFNNINE